MVCIRCWKTGKILIQLPEASLRGANLKGAHLQRAALRKKNLSYADMSGADLRSADLRYANLHAANLEGANLSGANLQNSDLSSTDLNAADLSRAILTGATCNRTIFTFTKLYRASIGYTTFAFCETLDKALLLRTVRHYGPSSIDHYTLKACAEGLPQEFLEGVGITMSEITDGSDLSHKRSKDHYFSCFISHASADSAFSEQLYEDLRKKGTVHIRP